MFVCPAPGASVSGFAANASQFPFPRASEPQRVDGSLIRNPRDGLITLMAYVVGEEHFDDNNGNGVYDLGEPFIDQGEPFVDWNDNNICDDGEEATVVQQDPSNGVWDPPNGVYDSTKLIWVDTKILATNSAAMGVGTLELRGLPIGTCATGGIEPGASASWDVYLPDWNYNRAYKDAILTIGPIIRGTASWYNGSALLDGYGFEYERVLADAVDPTAACTSGSSRCLWQGSFGNWGRGWVGTIQVQGTTASTIPPDPLDCKDVTLEAKISVLSTLVSTQSTTFGVK